MPANGNTNFLNAAAYAAEKSIDRQARLLWSTAHPVLSRITERKDSFKNAGQVKDQKVIIPINYTDLATPANGKSDANSLTAISPYAHSGDTQAEYEYSRYEAAFYIRPHEKQLLMNGQRMDLFDARTKTLLESFRNAISDDLAAASNATRENVLGLRYALSASNTVGGISQTDDTYWRAQLNTTGGTWSVAHVDDMYDTILALGRGTPDLLLLSRNATVNLYGRMRDQVAQLERVMNGNSKPNVNFTGFMYLDMECVLDNRLGSALSTTGGFMMLDTKSWYWVGDTRPTRAEPERLQGTNAFEFYYDMWGCLACDDIATNGYANGYTA